MQGELIFSRRLIKKIAVLIQKNKLIFDSATPGQMGQQSIARGLIKTNYEAKTNENIGNPYVLTIHMIKQMI